MKGNQNAVGNSGRPRSWDPIIEAEALLEWIKQPDAIILHKFSSSRGYCRDKFHLWNKECPEFSDAYKLAYEVISARREELALNSAIEKSVYHRHQGIYDKYLVAFEREEKEFDARLKAKVEAEITAKPEETARHEATMGQLKALQQSQESLARKIADTNSNTDNKSA